MKTEIQNIDENSIEIKLQGELDSSTAQKFATDLQPVMECANKLITMDFTELEYISSSSMRTILLLQKTALSMGGKVQIKGMGEEISQIFHLTGFDQMIEIL